MLQKGERNTDVEMGRVGSLDSTVLTPSFQSPATSRRNSMLLQGLQSPREQRKSIAVYQ